VSDHQQRLTRSSIHRRHRMARAIPSRSAHSLRRLNDLSEILTLMLRGYEIGRLRGVSLLVLLIAGVGVEVAFASFGP